MKKPGIFVKFENETVENAIKAHTWAEGYNSIEHAEIDTNISEPDGTKFDIIDSEGKILKSCIVKKG